MNKLVTVGLWLWISFTIAKGLRCNVCKYRIFAFYCIKGADACLAGPGLQCKKIFIKSEGQMLYIRKGCTIPGEKCQYTQGDESLTTMTLCCDTFDYCN